MHLGNQMACCSSDPCELMTGWKAEARTGISTSRERRRGGRGGLTDFVEVDSDTLVRAEQSLEVLHMCTIRDCLEQDHGVLTSM